MDPMDAAPSKAARNSMMISSLGSDPMPNRAFLEMSVYFCLKDEDKDGNGGIRVGWMRSAALAGTNAMRWCRAAHRNGVIMRLRNKVGADVRLVYIYLETRRCLSKYKAK